MEFFEPGLTLEALKNANGQPDVKAVSSPLTGAAQMAPAAGLHAAGAHARCHKTAADRHAVGARRICHTVALVSTVSGITCRYSMHFCGHVPLRYAPMKADLQCWCGQGEDQGRPGELNLSNSYHRGHQILQLPLRIGGEPGQQCMEALPTQAGRLHRHSPLLWRCIAASIVLAWQLPSGHSSTDPPPRPRPYLPAGFGQDQRDVLLFAHRDCHSGRQRDHRWAGPQLQTDHHRCKGAEARRVRIAIGRS